MLSIQLCIGITVRTQSSLSLCCPWTCSHCCHCCHAVQLRCTHTSFCRSALLCPSIRIALAHIWSIDGDKKYSNDIANGTKIEIEAQRQLCHSSDSMLFLSCCCCHLLARALDLICVHLVSVIVKYTTFSRNWKRFKAWLSPLCLSASVRLDDNICIILERNSIMLDFLSPQHFYSDWVKNNWIPKV